MEERKDMISRQAAIDALSFGKEMLSRVLDETDVVGTDREKYSWGLGLIESSIKDIEELPSAHPEQIARDIATIIENEKDMRVILKNTEPEQRWIPVTERLPDELAEVNVTWENTEPEPYYDFVKGHCFTGTAVYFCDRWYWYSAVCVDYLREYGFSPNDEMDDAIKVHAWMPLPEPYREEEQDE